MGYDWFYKAGDEVLGPVSPDAMRQRAHAGEIRPDTLVRKGVDGLWVRAAHVQGLFPPSGAQAATEDSPSQGTPLSAESPGSGPAEGRRTISRNETIIAVVGIVAVACLIAIYIWASRKQSCPATFQKFEYLSGTKLESLWPAWAEKGHLVPESEIHEPYSWLHQRAARQWESPNPSDLQGTIGAFRTQFPREEWTDDRATQYRVFLAADGFHELVKEAEEASRSVWWQIALWAVVPICGACVILVAVVALRRLRSKHWRQPSGPRSLPRSLFVRWPVKVRITRFHLAYAAVVLFVVFVWPTPYQYRTVSRQGFLSVYSINRLTQDVTRVWPQTPPQPYSEPEPLWVLLEPAAFRVIWAGIGVLVVYGLVVVFKGIRKNLQKR